MSSIGTATTSSATRVLFLGSGELGKEVVIEAQRMGIEVIGDAIQRRDFALLDDLAYIRG